MMHLGDYPVNATVRIPFDSFAAATGAPSVVTNYAAADVQIYKDGNVTQRASASGITATTSFDGLTGVNLITIDLSDNTTAGFYTAGSDYIVVIGDITVDGQTLRFVAGGFSIERSGGVLALIKAGNLGANVTQWSGTNVSTPGTAGIPEVNVKNIANAAVSTSSAQIGVNVVNAAGTAWNSGAIGASTLATDTITAAKIAADAIGASELAADAATEIGTAVWATAARTLTANTNLNDLSAAGVRAAVGLASANLDTQLTAIDDYIDTEVAAIKTQTDKMVFTVANQLDVNVLDWKSATAPAMTGDAFARIGALGAGLTDLGGMSTTMKAQVNTEADTALADYDAPTHTEMTAELATADDAVLAAIAALNNLSQANIRTAVGLGSANLDTQLDALPTNAELATALGTADDAVLAQVALVKAKTDNLPSDPADASDIAAAFGTVNSTLATVAGYIDTEVAAIKAKTDNLPSDPADQSLIIAATDAIAALIGTPAVTIADDIAAISAGSGPTATEIADEVETRTLMANIKKVNDITVTGNGQAATPWGP